VTRPLASRVGQVGQHRRALGVFDAGQPAALSVIGERRRRGVGVRHQRRLAALVVGDAGARRVHARHRLQLPGGVVLVRVGDGADRVAVRERAADQPPGGVIRPAERLVDAVGGLRFVRQPSGGVIGIADGRTGILQQRQPAGVAWPPRLIVGRSGDLRRRRPRPTVLVSTRPSARYCIPSPVRLFLS
jgi:hypothetical protein